MATATKLVPMATSQHSITVASVAIPPTNYTLSKVQSATAAKPFIPTTLAASPLFTASKAAASTAKTPNLYLI